MTRAWIPIISCWMLLWAAAGAAQEAHSPAGPAGAFPGRPVRVIVPQTPGSSVDFFARAVAERLQEKWGNPVVVDNRTGAGGAIAMEIVKQATPDGHTVVITTEGALAIIPHLYRNPSYDSLKDFAPVTRVASAPFVLVVNPSLSLRSVKELIARAKSAPGKINFASGGNGSGTHLSGELFKSMAGIDIVHIPYKGASLGVTDVIAGHVQMMFTGIPNALAQVRAGRLVALGVTTTRRSTVLPDVPTLSEGGLPGYEVAPWWGLLAPVRTPKAVVEKQYRDVAEVLKQEGLVKQYASQGAEPIGDTPAQFAKALKVEYDKWAKVIRDAGMRAQ